MDRQFIINSVKNLIPISLLLTFLFMTHHLSSDYYYHLSNQGQYDYPPMLSYLLALSSNRSLTLFALNLLFSTLIPYLLIVRITKNELAGFVYLYGTGIPLVLFTVWLVPQSIIQCLMLFAIAFEPLGLLIFILGSLTHEFWWAGFILTGLYIYAKRKGYLNGIN